MAIENLNHRDIIFGRDLNPVFDDSLACNRQLGKTHPWKNFREPSRLLDRRNEENVVHVKLAVSSWQLAVGN